MRPFTRKCGTCRELAVEPVTLPSYSMTMEHDGRPHEVTVNDLLVHQCSRCGAVMLEDDAEDRLFAALRQAASLLSPEEIRAGRTALGLTQVEMAKALQVGSATLSRWETGGQIQQRAMDLLLRAFFDLPEFREYLGSSTLATSRA